MTAGGNGKRCGERRTEPQRRKRNMDVGVLDFVVLDVKVVYKVEPHTWYLQRSV